MKRTEAWGLETAPGKEKLKQLSENLREKSWFDSQ